jgi:hypothetical protein
VSLAVSALFAASLSKEKKMNRLLIPVLFFAACTAVFALGPGTVETSHAQNGYGQEDIAVAMVVSPRESGRVWLSAIYSYPLVLAERDKLLTYVQAASRKIDIAVTNQTTISYQQEVGRFYTDDGAFLSVSFETSGYELSYAVVRIMNSGNNVILMLNKNDTRDFIKLLGTKRSLVDDYQRQVALFNKDAPAAFSSAP